MNLVGYIVTSNLYVSWQLNRVALFGIRINLALYARTYSHAKSGISFVETVKRYEMVQVNYAPPKGGELVMLPVFPRKAYIRLAG